MMSKKRRETPQQIAARVAKSAATRRERRGRAVTAEEAAALLDPDGKKARHAFSYKHGTKSLKTPTELWGQLQQAWENANKNSTQPSAIREQLLKDGLALTMGDRNRSYGDPFINFMLTARMKELFWDAMEASGKSVQQNSPFGHSIDMALTNLARIATSPTTHLERDRFLDGANYFAIAFEVGTRSNG